MLTLDCVLTPAQAKAEDKSPDQEDKDGVIGAVNSLFDPNEKTKTGKLLPSAYFKSAREVVKTLRESLKEDPSDNAKFGRTADAAKESIREYLSSWKGKEKVFQEESYVVLEKAIRTLASFYAKAGPSGNISVNDSAVLREMHMLLSKVELVHATLLGFYKYPPGIREIPSSQIYSKISTHKLVSYNALKYYSIVEHMYNNLTTRSSQL